VFLNFRHPYLSSSQPFRTVELDLYIPSLKLAFEYQGEQHYHQKHFGWTSLFDRQQKDQEKFKECQRQGITLIEIPYWWDRRKESLIATIRLWRPELLVRYSAFIHGIRSISREVPSTLATGGCHQSSSRPMLGCPTNFPLM